MGRRRWPSRGPRSKALGASSGAGVNTAIKCCNIRSKSPAGRLSATFNWTGRAQQLAQLKVLEKGRMIDGTKKQTAALIVGEDKG